MPLGLRHHAVPGVDKDDRQVARRRAGRHVARVLLVPGAIGNDELSLGRGKVAVRHVDRDSLLALGLESVGQQCWIEVATGSTEFLGVDLQGGELVFVHHLRVEQQSTDKRTLAVIDAAAS